MKRKDYSIKYTTLDRIDLNNEFCPKNCRWVTWEMPKSKKNVKDNTEITK